MPKHSLELNKLSTDQVSKLDVSKYVVVWPVSSLEQHGPHLPLGTDALILRAIVAGVTEKLGDGFKGLFLPAIELGKSPEHLSFPGTVSLQASTLLGIADDITASIAKFGSKRLAILNSHGGNSSLLQAQSFDLRQKYGVKVYVLDLWTGNGYEEMLARVFPDLQDMEVHAASLETSLMLFLYPELVGEIPNGNSAGRLLSNTSFGWNSKDFGENGVIGDPSYASSKAGEEIYHFGVDRIYNLLNYISEQQ
jgi:creatinine amidohydrolase